MIRGNVYADRLKIRHLVARRTEVTLTRENKSFCGRIVRQRVLSRKRPKGPARSIIHARRIVSCDFYSLFVFSSYPFCLRDTMPGVMQ